MSKRIEAMFEAFDRLSETEQAEFLAKVMDFSITNNPMSLATATASLGTVVKSSLGFKVLQQIHLNAYKNTKGPNGYNLMTYLCRNPATPDYLVDWIIEHQVKELIEVDRWSSSDTRSDRPHLTNIHLKNIVETYPVTADLANYMARHTHEVPLDLINVFALRWVSSFRPNDGQRGNPVMEVLDALLRVSGISEEFVRKAWDVFHEKRADIIQCCSIPQDLLDGLCQEMGSPQFGQMNWEKAVAPYVLRHPNVREEFLWFFFNKQSDWEELAKNPNLPTRMAKSIIEMGTVKDLLAILQNCSLDEKLWNDNFEKFLAKGVLRAYDHLWLFTMPQITPENLTRLWESDEMANLDRCLLYFTSPKATLDLRKNVIHFVSVKEYAPDFFSEALKADPFMPTELVDLVASMISGNGSLIQDTKLRLARQPNLSQSILVKWAKGKNQALAHAANQSLIRRGVFNATHA